MIKINKDYEPKFKHTFEDNMNLDVNSTLEELIKGIGPRNSVDVLKLLKEVYFISYTGMAQVMGVSGVTIRIGINHGSFDGVLCDEKLEDALLNLQYHFTRDTFAEVTEVE